MDEKQIEAVFKKFQRAAAPVNPFNGTDEELFSEALDDLLALPGEYKENLKSLNALISNKMPLAGGSLDSLIRSEFSGDELNDMLKTAGYDYNTYTQKGRRSVAQKNKGFQNLENPAPAEAAKEEEVKQEEPKFEPLPEPKADPAPAPVANNEEGQQAPAAPAIDFDANVTGSFEDAQLKRARQYANDANRNSRVPGGTPHGKFLDSSATRILEQEMSRRQGRAQIRSNHMEKAKQWIDANTTVGPNGQRVASNEDADRILRQVGTNPEMWDDGVMNSFVRNFNLGNLDAPVEKKDPTVVPTFNKFGPTGFVSMDEMEKNMGGKSIRPGTTMGPELDALMFEMEATQDAARKKGLSTPFTANYPRDLLMRAQTGEDFSGLRKAANQAIDSQIQSPMLSTPGYDMAQPPTSSPIDSFDIPESLGTSKERAMVNREVNDSMDLQTPPGTFQITPYGPPRHKGFNVSQVDLAQPATSKPKSSYGLPKSLSNSATNTMTENNKELDDILDMVPIKYDPNKKRRY